MQSGDLALGSAGEPDRYRLEAEPGEVEVEEVGVVRNRLQAQPAAHRGYRRPPSDDEPLTADKEAGRPSFAPEGGIGEATLAPDTSAQVDSGLITR